MSVEGYDVSIYQTSTPSLAGKSFLFAKASEGLGIVDPRYGMHTANARKAGLVVGAYHFGLNQDGVSQARFFLQHAGDVDLYAVDVEGRDPMTRQETSAFIAEVQKAGKKCGLYHSESGFFNAGQDFNWVANWSTTPSVPWHFHQYRGSPLDLDRFNGTLDQLRLLARKLPDSSTAGGNMPGLILTDLVSAPGTLKVKNIPGVLAISVANPNLTFKASPGGTYPTIGTGVLKGDPLGKDSPAGNRHHVRLIGGTPGIDLAAILEDQVDFTPTAAAQPPAADTTHTVALTVDGVEKAKVTV